MEARNLMSNSLFMSSLNSWNKPSQCEYFFAVATDPTGYVLTPFTQYIYGLVENDGFITAGSAYGRRTIATDTEKYTYLHHSAVLNNREVFDQIALWLDIDEQSTPQPPSEDNHDDAVLAVLESGQIYEFRNIGAKRSPLEFKGDENAVVDICGYHIYPSPSTTFRGANWLVGWKNMYNPGSMLVIEHRMGGRIEVLGDATSFQVKELITPALYVQTMVKGAILEFVNSGSEVTHHVNWTWSGYPKTTAHVGMYSMSYYKVHPDGSSSNWSAVLGDSGTSVAPGVKLVLHVNDGDWPQKPLVPIQFSVASHTTLQLMVKSYPPGAIDDEGQ